MIKMLITLLQLFAVTSVVPIGLYDISFQSADGKPINMSDFRGKKILVAAVSPDNLSKNSFQYLDSLQNAYPSIVMMIIPATDFGGSRNNEIVSNLNNGAKKKIIISSMSAVKKVNENIQHPLLQWLTRENTHFDADVSTDEQLYVISESGVLYAILEKGTPVKVLDDVFRQEDVKE